VLFDVSRVTTSSRVIAWFDWPAASIASTSSSRLVSGSTSPGTGVIPSRPASGTMSCAPSARCSRRFHLAGRSRHNAARSGGRPRRHHQRPGRGGSSRQPARERRTTRPPHGAARAVCRVVLAARGLGAGRRTGGGSATSRAPHRAGSGTGPARSACSSGAWLSSRPVTASHSGPDSRPSTEVSSRKVRSCSSCRSSTSSAR
jgi:hypothetical protein